MLDQRRRRWADIIQIYALNVLCLLGTVWTVIMPRPYMNLLGLARPTLKVQSNKSVKVDHACLTYHACLTRQPGNF